MSYIIISSPVGTGETDAIKKIKNVFGNDKVEHHDVETSLCLSEKARAAVSRLSGLSLSSSQTLTMREVTEDLPRKTVTSLWCEHLGSCLDKLFQSTATYKIVSCNLMLYGHVRSEFYSPVDISTFLKHGEAFKPSHVVVLIDDIYDMFLRLSVETQLYDDASLAGELQQIWSGSGRPGREDFGELERSYQVFRWKLNCLTQLLEWRHAEILNAESLANQTGAKFMVCGVKQLTEMTTHWLKESEAKAIYLSHPIAQSRRNHTETGVWDHFSYGFNRIQGQMLKENLSCIMPTGIDEFRFPKSPGISGMEPSLGKLCQRWEPPSPADIGTNTGSHYASLMYSLPAGSNNINHEDFFGQAGQVLEHASTTLEGQAARTRLQAFVDRVTSQVSARDHLLVAYADALLVYRPLYNFDGFAGGVQEEILHWYKGHRPRIAFIHFSLDVQTLFAQDEIKHRLENDARRLAVDLIHEDFKSTSKEDIERIIEEALEFTPRSMLGRLTGRAIQIKQDVPAYIDRAKESLVWYHLTRSRSIDETNTSLWIVSDEETVWSVLPNIAKFLNETSPRPSTEWKKSIRSMLKDTYF